jgi:hypothetical protein
MKRLNWQKRIGWLLCFSACLLFSAAPASGAGKAFHGKWRVTLTMPVAPNSTETRTFTAELNVSPREESSLHGRMLVTDDQNQTVGGVWRQVGKRVSITYELPCGGQTPCASVVLMGKMKAEFTRIKFGDVIVMWDTPNAANHAQFDTSTGTFTATRLE